MIGQMTIEEYTDMMREDYSKEEMELAKRIDELLCTEFDKNHHKTQAAAIVNYCKKCGVFESHEYLLSVLENYCLTMAEKKALREFGRFEELKRIYGEDE